MSQDLLPEKMYLLFVGETGQIILSSGHTPKEALEKLSAGVQNNVTEWQQVHSLVFEIYLKDKRIVYTRDIITTKEDKTYFSRYIPFHKKDIECYRFINAQFKCPSCIQICEGRDYLLDNESNRPIKIKILKMSDDIIYYDYFLKVNKTETKQSFNEKYIALI